MNPNGKPRFEICVKKSKPSNGFEYASLKDVPLEVRRKEARKPLFLTRYE